MITVITYSGHPSTMLGLDFLTRAMIGGEREAQTPRRPPTSGLKDEIRGRNRLHRR